MKSIDNAVTLLTDLVTKAEARTLEEFEVIKAAGKLRGWKLPRLADALELTAAERIAGTITEAQFNGRLSAMLKAYKGFQVAGTVPQVERLPLSTEKPVRKVRPQPPPIIDPTEPRITIE